MLERRTIRILDRLYEVKVKDATFKGKPVKAIQIVKDLGASSTKASGDAAAVGRSLHEKIWASSNLSTYVGRVFLDLVTVEEN